MGTLTPFAILLPTRCAVCARPGVELCDACLAAIVRIAPPVCERCGAPGSWPVSRCAECAGRRIAFARARGAIAYVGAGRQALRSWKARGRRGLTRLAAELMTTVLPRPEVDVLTFVPGDDRRTFDRGHAPPRSLALALGEAWELPVEPLLRRGRAVPRQRGLDAAQRRRNVSDVFVARERPPPRVGLVDDVYTTGSTANACAGALRRSGARRVEVVCLARAVR